MSKQKVTLQTAYWWYCDDCGAENFARSIKAELAQDEREDCFRRLNGLEAFSKLPEGWEEFEVVTMPTEVECAYCNAGFATEDERASDD